MRILNFNFLFAVHVSYVFGIYSTYYFLTALSTFDFLLIVIVALFTVKAFGLQRFVKMLVKYRFFFPTFTTFCYFPDLAHLNLSEEEKVIRLLHVLQFIQIPIL